VNPAQALPTIISSGSGNANIEAIKSYFTDEQVIRSIAGMAGMDFDTLVGDDYKLLEPIAYITFQGVKVAMTATESALYDEQVGGLLRSKMVSLSHKNLPLAMFLEVADLGYPAWSGSRSSAASDSDIKSSKVDASEILKKVQPEDLLKYGLIPEFIGRLPVMVTLDELTKDALVRIIKEPKNAILKQYKKLFQMDGVELEIEDDAIIRVAEKAIERKTGARGLRSILERVMTDIMYEIPSREDITKCIITKGTIDYNTGPALVLVEAKRNKKSEESAS